MPEDYALSLEEIKRMMANAGGTNLAGQSMAGQLRLVNLTHKVLLAVCQCLRLLHQALVILQNNQVVTHKRI